MIEHCNINDNQVRVRLFLGYLGLAETIFVLIIINLYKLPGYLVFPFAFLSAIGFVQARLRYCTGVATLEILKNPSKFKDEIYYILKVLIISLIISAIFTAITVLLEMYY